jgi:hypothetical protein
VKDYLATGQLVADDNEIKAIEFSLGTLLGKHGYGKYPQER